MLIRWCRILHHARDVDCARALCHSRTHPSLQLTERGALSRSSEFTSLEVEISAAPGNTVKLSADQKTLLVTTKATCPFIGSAVAQEHLPVLNEAGNPLASVEDVRKLGDSGGGNLGVVLALFAGGNHAKMRDASGNLQQTVPDGLFSLEFPGSQGSHAGHSGILQGDPLKLDSGRLSRADFKRLTDRQVGGLVKRSDFGRFIAENLLNDPNAKVQVGITAALIAAELGELVATLLSKGPTHRDVKAKFTKMLGASNLMGSAGEFGLLFAFLAGSPNTKEVDDEPALAVADLEAMFVSKKLPRDGRNGRSPLWTGRNTTALFVGAATHYHKLKR